MMLLMLHKKGASLVSTNRANLAKGLQISCRRLITIRLIGPHGHVEPMNSVPTVTLIELGPLLLVHLSEPCIFIKHG